MYAEMNMRYQSQMPSFLKRIILLDSVFFVGFKLRSLMVDVASDRLIRRGYILKLVQGQV